MNAIFMIMLRAVSGYLILNILMRIMGKREIGQLSLFDLLILLTIVDVMVIGIENYDTNYLYCIIPMIVMAILQIIFSLIALKWTKFRKMVDGKESIIIYKGKPRYEVMRKQKYNMDDLMAQLRQKDIRNISEVEYAILETGGRLSVFPYQKEDLGTCPLPLIISGEIDEDVLLLLNYSKEFLLKELTNLGIKDYHKVLYASLVNGKLEVILTPSKPNKLQ